MNDPGSLSDGELRPPQDRSGWASRFIESFSNWFSETTLRIRWAVLGAGILSIILSGALWFKTILPSQELTAYRASSAVSRPNVIWITLDALSAEDMSLFGYSLPTTPNLERIAKDWTVFVNAQSPFTCSVKALPVFMSGRYPYLSQYASYGDLMESQDGWANLPNILQDAGYQTWWQGYLTPGFYHLGISFDHLACPAPAFMQALDRSWMLKRVVVINEFPFVPLSLEQLGLFQETQDDFARCANLSTLQDVLSQETLKPPYFIYYHFMGAHAPYISGQYQGIFLPTEYGQLDWQSQKQLYGTVPPEKRELVPYQRLRYDEGIRNRDQEFGEFIDRLKDTGIYDSSLIIVTADHGQVFTDQYTSHCTPLLSHAETHVPLLIKYPGQTTGVRYKELVSTADIAPTVLKALGFQYPAGWFDGQSLINMDDSNAERIVFSLNTLSVDISDTIYAAMDGQYRLVHRRKGYSLYRYHQDPEEKKDFYLEAVASNDSRLVRLQTALDAFEKRTLDLNQGKSLNQAMPLPFTK